MGKVLWTVKRKLLEMSRGWTLWLTLSMLAGIIAFIVPTPPGAFTIAFIVVLGIGKIFFIKTRLTGADIFLSMIAISIIMFVYTAYSLMVISNISFFKLVVIGLVMDLVAMLVYYAIGLGRFIPKLGKLSSVIQRLAAITAQSLIAIWAFQAMGAFLLPIIVASNLLRVGLHPTTTYLLIFVKLIGSAF